MKECAQKEGFMMSDGAYLQHEAIACMADGVDAEKFAAVAFAEGNIIPEEGVIVISIGYNMRDIAHVEHLAHSVSGIKKDMQG